MIIKYNTTEAPAERGVYACRIPHDIDGLYDDEFLIWFDGWFYCGSDQKFRGEVVGWIGPLQRRM